MPFVRGIATSKENQIGLEFPSFLDNVFAIDCLAANIKISLGEI
ncbi:MAG: hypothetical protein WA658_07710 [Candidatus Acidiferrales bacterium]